MGSCRDTMCAVSERKEYNYNIALIKAFMAYCVVCCHFWKYDSEGFYPADVLLRMRDVAAPVFMVVSFLLTYRMFRKAEAGKLGKRMLRLAVPQVTWGLIYYVIYVAVDKICLALGKDSPLILHFIFKDLILQLVFGGSQYIAPQFWFQFDLIVATLLFWCVCKFCGKYSRYVIAALGVFALLAQYMLWNYNIFCHFEYAVWYAGGRFAEMLPFAAAGFILADADIMEKLKQKWVLTAASCAAIMLLISYVASIPRPLYGFAYEGGNLLLYGVLAFMLLYVLPVSKLPAAVLSVLKFLSRYSFGVFCIHYIFGWYWSEAVCASLGWKDGTQLQCLVLYAVSVLLAWLISLIPSKFAKMLVE